MKLPYLSSCKRSVALLALAALVVLQLVGCGGGGNYASGGIVGTGASGRATQGVITALGNHSITVNGQTFATASAGVMINGQAAADSALKVGMVVSVLNTLRSDGSMTVSSIEYRAEVQGVVTGVDPAAQTFTVLGQRVSTDRLTLYDGGTFDTLLNQVVEVSGFRSTPGDLLATLVIIKPAVVPPAKATLVVTGVVSALNPAPRTFVIGLQVLDYSGIAASSVPAGLGEGATVRVSGQQTSLAGPLFADSIAVVPLAPPDVTTFEIEGLITEFAGLGSFKVNGQLVDARGAAIEGGTVDMIANGALVEVDGQVSGGILVATKVEIEQATVIAIDGIVGTVDAASGTVTVGGQLVRVTSDTQFIDSSAAAVTGFSLAAVHPGDHLSILAFRGDNGVIATRVERLNADAPPPNQPSTSIQGTISNFVSIANFVVAGQQVSAGGAAFFGGTAANLANGVGVAVDGTLANGILTASKVQFLPGSPAPTALTVTGTISDFTSVANFTVAGQRVDASSASFSNGHATDLADGRSVTVKGIVQSGTLVAQTVSFSQPSQTTTLEIEGTISSFVSVGSFVVAGQSVNASQATISNGTAGDLANGRKVQVKGVLQSGVLIATTVQLEDSAEPQEISVQGLITNFVSTSNFVVAGRTVDATNARFDGGSAANLANGKKVQVQGFLVGQVLKATELEFDD
jgi:hypothetical protein